MLNHETISYSMALFWGSAMPLPTPQPNAATQAAKTDTLLRLIATGTSAEIGESFFQSLTRNLALALQVRYVFVTECLDQPPTRVRTLAFWADDHFGEPMEYDLAGTPCELTIHDRDMRVFACDLGKYYAEDVTMGAESYIGVPLLSPARDAVLGHMAIMHMQPLTDETLASTVFEIFAARAGAELQRLRAEQARRHAEALARQHFQEMAHAARLASMGQMASVMAHELNQPLTAILSFAQACLRQLDLHQLDPRELREALHRMAANAERGGQIVQRIRGFVRKQDGQAVAADLNVLIRDTLELISAELKRLQIAIQLNLAPAFPLVMMDTIQIQQVMVNLLRNSMDAVVDNVNAAKDITITTQYDNEKIELRIKDTGPGIPEHILAHLFEPFVSTKAQGMGIGLSICQSIIDAHGGQLALIDHGPTGACFAFSLTRHTYPSQGKHTRVAHA
jgi:signal transduction histidine kinase